MGWKARLDFSDESIEVDGTFDTKGEAYEAAQDEASEYYHGRDVLGDMDDEDPTISVYRD